VVELVLAVTTGEVQGIDTAFDGSDGVAEGMRRVRVGIYFDGEPMVEAEGLLLRVVLMPQVTERVLPADPK
jgi:hypothetical protein